jgi:hypothetical protein
MKIEGACNKIHVCTLTPSPTLPQAGEGADRVRRLH